MQYCLSVYWLIFFIPVKPLPLNWSRTKWKSGTYDDYFRINLIEFCCFKIFFVWKYACENPFIIFFFLFPYFFRSSLETWLFFAYVSYDDCALISVVFPSAVYYGPTSIFVYDYVHAVISTMSSHENNTHQGNTFLLGPMSIFTNQIILY